MFPYRLTRRTCRISIQQTALHDVHIHTLLSMYCMICLDHRCKEQPSMALLIPPEKLATCLCHRGDIPSLPRNTTEEISSHSAVPVDYGTVGMLQALQIIHNGCPRFASMIAGGLSCQNIFRSCCLLKLISLHIKLQDII